MREEDTEINQSELREALSSLESMLITGETIQAYAVQRRLFALAHRRVIVAATSGRLIGINRGLLGGFTPVDLRWQDIKSAHVRAGVFGSDLIVTGLTQPDLATDSGVRTMAFEGLRKDDAQAVYRACQAQEQAWREKRRLRELEELRAKSGGFLASPETRQSPTQGTPDDADAIARLQRAKDMLEQGLISDSEYETVKARIIGQL